MGIIAIAAIILLIVEIIIRGKIEVDEPIFNNRVLFMLVFIFVILPVGLLIYLETDLIKKHPDNIRENFKRQEEKVNQKIVIEDDAIKRYIYKELNKSLEEKITRKELLNIKKIENLRAKDLRELSFLKELEYLSIEWTADNTLISIQNLKKLEFLSFKNAGKIDSIDPIENLDNLKVLSFESSKITNIESISYLKNLEELYITGPNIRDLSPIDGATELKKFIFNGEKIIDKK